MDYPRPHSLGYFSVSVSSRTLQPHTGPSTEAAERIKHSNMTSATENSLAKAHLVKKEKKDNKQITAMKCGKCNITCKTLAFPHCITVGKDTGLHVSLPGVKYWSHFLATIPG